MPGSEAFGAIRAQAKGVHVLVCIYSCMLVIKNAVFWGSPASVLKCQKPSTRLWGFPKIGDPNNIVP